MNDCPLCGKPIPDTAYVCPTCATDLAANLLRTATRWDSLEDAIGRRLIVDRNGSAKRTDRHALEGPWCWGGGHDCGHPSCRQVWSSRVTARQESPLPHEDPGLISPEASEAMFVAQNVVTTWARHVESERGLPIAPAPRPTLEGPRCGYDCAHWTCRHVHVIQPVLPVTDVDVLLYLARQVGWLAHRPEALEAFDELADAAVVVQRTIDTATRRVYLGPCDVCSADLYARPGQLEAECKPCALIYPVAARREWLLGQAEDRLARTAEVCRALRGWGVDVTSDRLKVWAARGLVIARSRDAVGRPLYRVGDVVAVAHRMATRREEAG